MYSYFHVDDCIVCMHSGLFNYPGFEPRGSFNNPARDAENGVGLMNNSHLNRGRNVEQSGINVEQSGVKRR